MTTTIVNIYNCGHKPRLRCVGVEEIPRRKEPIMVGTGNHYFDKVILRLSVAPDGDLDSPPTWATDQPAVLLTPSADGLSCDCRADTDVGSFTITATAPADNPTTPELEAVSEQFSGSFSHSKATALNGAFSEVPRV